MWVRFPPAALNSCHTKTNMANNPEQTSTPTSFYQNRLHQLTFVQEISVNDIFFRNDHKLFQVLAISNNKTPIINYRDMKQVSYKTKDGETIIECKPVSPKIGIMSCLKLRRFGDNVVAYTHRENELIKIDQITKK